MTNFKLFREKLGPLGLLSVLSIFLITGVATGCNPSTGPNIEPSPVPAVQEPQVDEKAILEAYNKLMTTSPQPKEVFEFLDQNVKKLSKEKVASMINDLEKLQKDHLPKLEERFYKEEVQGEFGKLYMAKKDINNSTSAETEELKDLVVETAKSGYKVETAEGAFFPIVDYSAYKEYVQYMTEDLKAYIEIMSVESDKVPAKDAALVIPWEDLVRRAIRQEAFINKYADSSKLAEVKELHKNYMYFVFFGLNNTPLFDYQNKLMNEEAKAAYGKIDLNSSDSKVMENLKGYMELLEKDGYKLTKEVEKFRNDIVGKQ